MSFITLVGGGVLTQFGPGKPLWSKAILLAGVGPGTTLPRSLNRLRCLSPNPPCGGSTPSAKRSEWPAGDMVREKDARDV